MRGKKLIGAGLVGGAMVAIGALAARAQTKKTAAAVRSHHDALIDEVLAPYLDVTEQTLATRDGGKIHYIDTGGDGPLVVLCHGVMLQAQIWAPLIRRLVPRYRVVAWDMRGHGQSTVGRNGMTMSALAADLASLLEEVDAHDAIVVGHSLGGMLTGNFVGLHPDVVSKRVGGIVFLATTGATWELTGMLERLDAIITVGLAKMGPTLERWPRLSFSWDDNDRSTALVRMAFGKDPTAAEVEQVRVMAASCPKAVLHGAGSAIAQHDASEALRSLQIPTSIVVGKLDRLTSPAHARAIAALVPHAELTVLDDVGHQVMAEAPDELAAAIDRLAERITAAR